MITYRTTGLWGAGKGSNLTLEEVDTNFHDVDQTLDAAEAAMITPDAVSGVTVDGYQFSVALSDGRVYGPKPMPITGLRLVNAYIPGAEYKESNLLLFDKSVWLITQTHIAPTEFDPTYGDTEGAFYHKVWGEAEQFDLAAYIPGPPPPLVYQLVSPRQFIIPDGASGCIFARVAPSVELGFVVLRNALEVGTMTIPAGQNTGVVDFPSLALFGPEDVLSVETLPESTETETTGADISFTLTAIRDV